MTQQTTAATPAVQMKKFQEETVGRVLGQVKAFDETGELNLPKEYSPGNALKSAWLILLETKDTQKRPVLESCSKESIANALLDMSLQGLSPMKKQCAFIAYGNKLTMQREYHGNIALARRYGGVKDVRANVIYEGDDFAFAIDTDTGLTKIIKHTANLDNVDNNKIKGAYATVILNNGTVDVEIMTMAQIQKAWDMGTGGATPAHKNFKDQMCKKTVINRACKLYISTSSDGGLVEDKEPAAGKSSEKEVKKAAINEKANKKELNIEEAEVVDEKPKEELPVKEQQGTGSSPEPVKVPEQQDSVPQPGPSF